LGLAGRAGRSVRLARDPSNLCLLGQVRLRFNRLSFMSANAEELLTASITVALLAEQWGLDHMNPNLLFREGSNGAFLSRKALIESLATQPKPLVCIATVSGESLI
jgi:hypothetical protein